MPPIGELGVYQGFTQTLIIVFSVIHLFIPLPYLNLTITYYGKNNHFILFIYNDVCDICLCEGVCYM